MQIKIIKFGDYDYRVQYKTFLFWHWMKRMSPHGDIGIAIFSKFEDAKSESDKMVTRHIEKQFKPVVVYQSEAQ